MFGFVYEDSCIEKQVIKNNLFYNTSHKLDGLMILSGGCTMFDIAKYFSNGNLTAIDFNQEQINLVKNKINLLNDPEKYNNYLSNINLPFDNLFLRIKNKEPFNDVFSNDNLIEKFGLSAVSNTDKSFSNHFEQIYFKQSIYYDWIWNRNFQSKFIDKNLKQTDFISDIKKVNILHGNLLDFIYPNLPTYDFIQTSNLTDWMNVSEFEIFCNNIKKSLKPNGVLIMRRLLSNNILIDKFPNALILYDKTNFYSETICYINKI